MVRLSKEGRKRFNPIRRKSSGMRPLTYSELFSTPSCGVSRRSRPVCERSSVSFSVKRGFSRVHKIPVRVVGTGGKVRFSKHGSW